MKQLTLLAPKAASSLKPGKVGGKAIWEKSEGRSTPVNALHGLATANCFTPPSSLLSAFAMTSSHRAFAQAVPPPWLQLILQITTQLLLLHKRPPDLQGSTPPTVWVNDQDFRVKMSRFESSSSVYYTCDLSGPLFPHL